MKSLITIGIVLAAVGLATAPAWSASGPPPGSYLQSCRNVYLDSSTGKPKVYADCPDHQGRYHHSGTQYMKCGGDIANQDGELACVQPGSGPGPAPEPGPGPIGGMPAGSWQQSCRQPALNGSMLTAACLRGSGGYSLSSLDIRSCGGGPVGNRNGNLFCEGGAPGGQGAGQGNDQGNEQGGGQQGNEQGGQSNGQGAGQGSAQGAGQGMGGSGQPMSAGGGMPAGSWQRSCRAPHLAEGVLTANCQRRDGAFHYSALDLESCAGGPVGNENGRLVCESGGQGGGGAAPQDTGAATGGGLPPGSWQQSCSNPQLNGSVLTASCMRRDGGSRFSALDVRSCPGGRVGNFEGSLACE